MLTAFRSLGLRYSVVPVAALALLGLTWGRSLPALVMAGVAVVLISTVFVAVHHAEVVALRVGEPFGSLILAVSVTVIEVGMIVVLILESPETSQNLARDTVFAALMITLNGIVGVSILVKTLHQRVASFTPAGVSGALSVVAALSALTLILPSVTVSAPGQAFTTGQLVFAAVISLILYGTFLAFQTVRHRDYFLPPPSTKEVVDSRAHVAPPDTAQTILSFIGLVASLVAVVGLAKVSSPLIQGAVTDFGLPQAIVAITIALVVLMPESVSAVRAARFGRTQTSLNLAYGSALASIGLTIPAVAVISVGWNYQMNLGLNSAETVLLSLTLLVSVLTVVPGKASMLHGVLHLSILGSFLAFVVMP
jgi:Ca2+:H+ antiporter